MRHRQRTIRRKEQSYRQHNRMQLTVLAMDILNEYAYMQGIYKFGLSLLRHLKENDPKCFMLIKRINRSILLRSKLKNVRKLAEYCFEPVGGIWPQSVTSAAFNEDVECSPDDVKKTISTWNTMFK